MRIKNRFAKSIVLAMLIIFSAGVVSAEYFYNTPSSYYGAYTSSYYGALSSEQCEKGKNQDFIIEILPGSCSPSVVRSDLLEEQRVPVFCKITGYKINPLIEVPYIKSVSIAGGIYPKDIESITFHPYRAALRTTYSQLVGTPFENELGYVVIFLKPNPVEKTMPNEIIANLSARILYDTTTSFGIGENELIIPQTTDEQWRNEYKQYGFWYGKGYVRATQVKEDAATIQLYFDPDRPASTISLSKNKESQVVYLPGSYCSYGLKATLNDVIYPSTKAILDIDGNKVEAYQNMQIADGCRVTSIDTTGYNTKQSITISCGTDQYILERDGLKADLTVDGTTSSYGIGDSVKVGSENYSIVFIGTYPDKSLIALENDAEISKKPNRQREISVMNSNLQSKFEARTILKDDIKPAVLIVNEGSIRAGSKDIKITINVDKNKSQTVYSPTLERYYQLSLTNYQEVVKSWPLVELGDGQPLGEKALLESAEKAMKLGKQFDAMNYYEQFLERYPQSKNADGIKEKLRALYLNTDNSKASSLIRTPTKDIYVTLNDVKEPTADQLSINLFVNGKEQTLGYKETIGDWVVSDIKENAVTFNKIIETKDDKPKVISKGVLEKLDNKTEVKITKVNLARYAKITLSPYSREGETSANFTVHVGIEKRAIQLSPEQTQSLINGLNKQITQWQKINDQLKNVVEKWKKTCFIGTGALWVWNFFDNLNNQGQAMARELAMNTKEIIGVGGTKYSGWTGFCEDSKNWDGAGSISECIFKNKDSIDADVKSLTGAIQDTNKIMQEAMDTPGVIQKTGLFQLTKRVNETAYSNALQNVLKKNGYTEFDSIGVSSMLQNGRLTKIDIRDALLELNSKKECGSRTTGVCSLEDSAITKIMDKITLASEADKKSGILDEFYGSILGKDAFVPTISDMKTAAVQPAYLIDASNADGRKVINDNSALFSGVKWSVNNTLAVFNLRSVQEKNYVDAKYIAVLTGEGREAYDYSNDNLYKYDAAKNQYVKMTEKDNSADIRAIRANIGQFKKQTSCDNIYNNPEIQFWDTGPNKGFPAIMPLGVFNGMRGFYVATESSGLSLTAGLTNSQAFAESGEPQIFYICNVGKDGKPDFGKTGGEDENCQRFSLSQTYEGQTAMCDGALSKDQTAQLVKRAISCMKQASSQYGKAVGQVKTSECGSFNLGTGKSAAPKVKCEDYMSPEKCTILYNLCDPVICPPSRCDFGGRYPTDNVIQTGVVGSLFLCLPNRGLPSNGGVLVPVCLTGIHAGVENWLSIMKSTRDCLQTSLDSGRNVGICDELKSVYICELFWKEITPFIKTGIPYLVESTVYQRRGGGEYLTFQSTWENSINQFNYITQYYGANALRAFQVRSTAEAGSMLCKAFVGLRYPDQGSLFDEMAKAESPPQINAWFDEAAFSSVTVPPISHYKIYWHIFAGNDEPVYWSVYLEEPPSFTYPLPERQEIASGFLEKGASSDETRDVTLASGYKKLCVRINLKSYCGFQKVTTGFAVEELVNYYLNDQTVPEYEIKNADECTSGTASLLTGTDLATSLVPLLTQPGQGGLIETLQPEIYKRGIIRVCSQTDPGKGVDTGRWKIVGNCDSNKKIRCWVDTQSVKGAIYDLQLRNLTLSEAETLQNQLLAETGKYLNENLSATRLSEIKKNISDYLSPKIEGIDSTWNDDKITALISPTINDLKEIVQYSLSDKVKAEAQTTIAAIYNQVTVKLSSFEQKKTAKSTSETKTAVQTPDTSAKTEAIIKDAQNVVTYTTTGQENLQDIVKKMYGDKLQDLQKSVGEIQQTNKLKSVDVPANTQIRMGLTNSQITDLMNYVSFLNVGTASPNEEVVNPVYSCGQAASEICHNIVMEITGSGNAYDARKSICYIKKSTFIGITIPFTSSCNSCFEATKCTDLNHDSERCENKECTGKIGPCSYDSEKDRCIGSTYEADASAAYSAVVKTLSGLSTNQEKIKALEQIILKYPNTDASAAAVKVMFNFAEKDQTIEAYQILSKFSTDAYQKIDPAVYAQAIIAKNRINAIQTFRVLNENLASCSRKNNFCKCGIDVQKMSEMDGYSVSMENGKLILKSGNTVVYAASFKQDMRYVSSILNEDGRSAFLNDADYILAMSKLLSSFEIVPKAITNDAELKAIDSLPLLKYSATTPDGEVSGAMGSDGFFAYNSRVYMLNDFFRGSFLISKFSKATC